jgi:hypothetical protein
MHKNDVRPYPFGGQAVHDNRHRQIASPISPARDQPIQTQSAQRAQDRGDVTVGQRTLDLKDRVNRRHVLAPKCTRISSMTGSGKCGMLPTVSCLTLPSSRYVRRRRWDWRTLSL